MWNHTLPTLNMDLHLNKAPGGLHALSGSYNSLSLCEHLSPTSVKCSRNISKGTFIGEMNLESSILSGYRKGLTTPLRKQKWQVKKKTQLKKNFFLEACAKELENMRTESSVLEINIQPQKQIIDVDFQNEALSRSQNQ